MEEERAGGCEEDMMGFPGCTGETAIESEVGEEEEAGVGVVGALPPLFCTRQREDKCISMIVKLVGHKSCLFGM